MEEVQLGYAHYHLIEEVKQVSSIIWKNQQMCYCTDYKNWLYILRETIRSNVLVFTQNRISNQQPDRIWSKAKIEGPILPLPAMIFLLH